MMRARPSLLKNFSWTLAGNVTYAACLWGILAVLTKMGDPATVGRFSLASVIATPVIMFANLQFRSVLASDTAGGPPFQDYLGLRLLLLPLAVAVAAAIGIWGYNSDQALVIFIFAVARAVESVSDLLYGYQQKHERLDLVAVSLAIKGVASLILFWLVFGMTRNLVYGLLALTTGWLLPLVMFDFPRTLTLIRHFPLDSLRPRWNWPTMRELLWLTLPLGTVMLFIQLRNTIPRTVLESVAGEDVLGIFAALSYLVIAGTTVALALSQSSLARLSAYRSDGDYARFRSTVTNLVLLGLGLGIGGVLVALLAGRPLLSLLYAPEYAEHADLLILIMMAGGVLYVATLLGAPATALRAFRGQMWIHLTNIFFLTGMSVLLIPRYGMQGAAYAILASALWVAAGYGLLVWRGMQKLKQGVGS